MAVQNRTAKGLVVQARALAGQGCAAASRLSGGHPRPRSIWERLPGSGIMPAIKLSTGAWIQRGAFVYGIPT